MGRKPLISAAFVAALAMGVAGSPALADSPAGSGCAVGGDFGGDEQVFAVSSAGSVFVANRSGSAIARLAPGAHGDMQPADMLCGPDTHLTSIRAMTADGSRLYVAQSANVLVFDLDARGDEAPRQVIGGAQLAASTYQNQAGGPVQIVLGPNDSMYVLNLVGADVPPFSHANTLFKFSREASGDVAPMSSTLETPNKTPLNSIVLDSHGRVYAIDWSQAVWISNPDLGMPFRQLLAGQANSLVGKDATSLALDAQGRLYVGGLFLKILIVTGATGAAKPHVDELLLPGPQADIVEGLATDDAGRIYVQTCGYPNVAAIRIYAGTARGKAAPIAILSGPTTKVSCEFPSR
jgi:hypothetical protein